MNFKTTIQYLFAFTAT